MVLTIILYFCSIQNLPEMLKLKHNNIINLNEIENYFDKVIDIIVYIDKYYGIVLHLEKEEFDYYEYSKNQVDMRLVTIHTDFMYEVDDIPFDILNKVNFMKKYSFLFVIFLCTFFSCSKKTEKIEIL